MESVPAAMASAARVDEGITDGEGMPPTEDRTRRILAPDAGQRNLYFLEVTKEIRDQVQSTAPQRLQCEALSRTLSRTFA